MVQYVDEHLFLLLSDIPEVVRLLGLYHNNRNGTFSDVTSLLGDSYGYPSNLKGAGFQPIFFDYDNDNDLDIYVVNDFGVENYPNVLWRNDGPSRDGNWKFTDVSELSGADASIYGMGVAVGDYNNDGNLDLYMSDIGANDLLRNNGDGTFTDQTAFAGVAAPLARPIEEPNLAFGWGAP